MITTRRRRRGRGGQGGHDPRARIHTRERRAMELAVLGWSQPQIAADLGISQAAVSKLLKRIETRLLRELAETVQRQKARQTLRLEHLFAEAMRAWNESKADTTRRRQRQTQGGDGGAGATVAELVVENQHGDPRYLDEARKALADQRKLWGLDAPQKVDLHASRDPYDDMPEAALRAELARQSQLLGVADPTVIGVVTAEAVTVDRPNTHTVTPAPPTSSEAEATNVDHE
jgi:DNA-binding CsgD family transcriptional regulator